MLLACLNLSSTPETPKSGEVQLQTAPMEATAAMISIASGQLGMYPAILSPLVIPWALRALAMKATLFRSWPKVLDLSPIS